MALLRWFQGLLKVLVGMWDSKEHAYFAKTGLDPKIPAHQRWEVRTRQEERAPETAAEEVLPGINYTVILHDKYGQTADDVIVFTRMVDQSMAVQQLFEKELRSRTSGDFWDGMIRNRNLDYALTIRPIEEPLEGSVEVDDDLRREMFRQQ